MSRVRCFWLEKTPFKRVHLRRYSLTSELCCGLEGRYCNAKVVVLQQVTEEQAMALEEQYPPEHGQWPKKCERCGRAFAEEDPKQWFVNSLWQRADNQELVTLQDDIPGAMYYADWYLPHIVGPDGHCLAVILPNNHPWLVDSRASNCDMPDDDEHRCWVRHGVPPDVTVDKNGLTCGAGAGSIGSGVQGTPTYYHGFLTEGYLVEQ